MTKRLPDLPPGISLISHETVTSTNYEAKLLANDDAPEGTVVWAKAQTHGKGRMNRNWVSKPGNLYSSIILRPSTSLTQATQIAFLPALALGELLARFVPVSSYSFKWPNDVLLNKKKFSGTLLESGDWSTNESKWLVIGCGVNLAHSPTETRFPATSIFEETKQLIPV
ncbi:MAG: biotin--[acetyl-CoA-carboxylase] ligase, partial [Rhodospirillales bacterium]